MSNLRDIMQMFRERDEAIKRVAQSIGALDTIEQADRAMNLAEVLSDLNRRLATALQGDVERAKKFYALCKRTHWTASTAGGATDVQEMQSQCARLLRQSQSPVRGGFRPDMRCERHRVSVPLVDAALEDLTPFASIDEIGCMLNARADRYLLCRVMCEPVVNVGIQFVAEDAAKNAFFVHVGDAPISGSKWPRAFFGGDGIGTIVAVCAPVLTLSSDGWQPVIKCPLEGNCRIVGYRSAAHLRGTPWFEEPCKTPLEWKVRGNERFAAHRYDEALHAYTIGLALDETQIDLRANRTTVWIKLGNWVAAINDADVVLARDKSHRKCAMRRAAALHKTFQFNEAAEAWVYARSLCAADAVNDVAECEAGERRARLGIEQSAGRFDWPAVMASLGDEVATYFHPLVTLNDNKPRGLVATAPLKRGELVLVETAAAATLWQRDLADALLGCTRTDITKQFLLDDILRERVPDHDAGGRSVNVERVAASCALDFWPSHAWRHRSDLRAWRGVGLKASLLRHSCRPNCAVTTVGTLIIVQTIADIAVDGELFVARCRIDVPLVERRSALEQMQMPPCECARCTAEAKDAQCERLMRRFFQMQYKIESGVNDIGQVEPLARALIDHPLARDSTLSFLMSMSFGFARGRSDMQPVRDLVVQAHSRTNAVDLASCTLMLHEMEQAYSKEAVLEWLKLIVPSTEIVNLEKQQ
jgi:hypothetical protein